jgi:hypothetical protein
MIMVATVVYPAFGPPALADSPPDDLQGPVIDYGGMSFVGYQIDDPAIHLHDWKRVKLCWETLPNHREIPVPYAFALHIVGPENTILGGRESYPGLGTYTLWEPGKLLRHLPVTGEVIRAFTHRVSIMKRAVCSPVGPHQTLSAMCARLHLSA